jgi:putative cell surface protein
MGVSYTKIIGAASVAAIVGIVALHSPVSAAPASFTWTGSAGDHKMSTAGNWKEGQVPTEGSKLVFKCADGPDENIQNDLTVALSGLEVKKLDSLPDDKSCAYYRIDTMRFTPDAEFTGDKTNKDSRKIPLVYVTGAVTGLSNLKSNGFDGRFDGKPTISRFEVANAGCNYMNYYIKAAEKIVGENASVSLDGANSILVKNKGQLGIDYYDNETSASKITFENGSMISHGIHCQFGGGSSSNVTTVLSGDITLNGDVEYWLASNVTLKITGKLSGPGKLVAHKDNEGTVLVESSNNTSGTPNGQIGNAHEAKTIQLDGDKPDEFVTVKKGETVLLNGSRSEVSVDEGGVFGGDATVKSLYVSGVVTPGNSPGKITVLETFSLQNTGVYKAEILNKDHYDQIVAHDVRLNGSLDLTYLAGGVIKKGDTFTIVNNNGNRPVQGTFKDLPEGAEVTVSGATFKISYVGGDGNDVVLTAQNDSKAPKVPNTGGEKLSVNLIGAIAGVASAAALLFVTKRKSLSKK